MDHIGERMPVENSMEIRRELHTASDLSQASEKDFGATAVKLGGDHLARLAGSAAAESSVLALLGTGFLIFASAVRRLKTTED